MTAQTRNQANYSSSQQPAAELTRRSAPGPAYWLSSILSGVALLATAGSFFIPDLFSRDPAALGGCARGTALFLLVVDIPAIIICMFLTRRGSLRAPIIWLAAVSQVLYNAVYYAFSATFNSFFFIYIAMLSLAVWSLAALLQSLPVAEIGAAFSPKTPARWIAGFSLLPVLMYIQLDVVPSLSAIASRSLPANIIGTQTPTNHFAVMDLAFSVPLLVLGAVWLWRRKPWGFVLTGTMLTYFAAELLCVATDQYFGTLADPNFPQLASMAIIPALAVFFIIFLVPLGLFYGNIRPQAR